MLRDEFRIYANVKNQKHNFTRLFVQGFCQLIGILISKSLINPPPVLGITENQSINVK
jgi:hypothetical protein